MPIKVYLAQQIFFCLMLNKNLFNIFIIFYCSQLWADSYIPNEVTINGIIHFKAYESLNNPNQFVEYIPKGENLDSWSSLVGIYHFIYVQDPKIFAKTIEEKIKAREQGKTLSLEFIENDPYHVMQTYVLWGPTEKSQVLEENAWRYQKIQGVEGVMAIQYATRKYLPSDQTPHIGQIKPIPETVIEELKKLPLNEYKF